MVLKKVLYHAVGKRTPEEEIRDRVKIIKELVEQKMDHSECEDIETSKIRQQFYLDGLAVADKNGEIVRKDGEADFDDIMNGTGVYDKLIEELPETEIFTLRKGGENNIIYNGEERVYLMKTPGNISMPEIKRIKTKLNGGR